MYPDVFLKLSNILREKTHLQDTRYICVEEILAVFLLVVGHNTRYCLIRKTFDRSHYNTSQNFNKVLKALHSIVADIMVKPGAADCIGAIDGTHIPATVLGRDTNSYCNRHGTISQNVLAACNFDLEFIYVLSGWERSAHDSNVLTDALSRNNGLKVTQGKLFLVDGGYPNRRQFLAPFRGVCYHLQEFTGQCRHPEDAKELFNVRHASLRNVIERIFGIFKSRFKIFKTTPLFHYKTQTDLVLACAGLHNFLRSECRSDEFSVETETEVPPSSSEKIYEDGNFDQLFDTQKQQRANANAWRDAIANQIWSDVEQIVNIN
ncbi:uncharacterized protein [Henckelia pumila]|uniref:uncharacterized protein n=1 Tax=Henckelia pumila TaxID=405737 RepID=UPI003C6E942D